jgi:hypothetical protein
MSVKWTIVDGTQENVPEQGKYYLVSIFPHTNWLVAPAGRGDEYWKDGRNQYTKEAPNLQDIVWDFPAKDIAMAIGDKFIKLADTPLGSALDHFKLDRYPIPFNQLRWITYDGTEKTLPKNYLMNQGIFRNYLSDHVILLNKKGEYKVTVLHLLLKKWAEWAACIGCNSVCDGCDEEYNDGRIKSILFKEKRGYSPYNTFILNDHQLGDGDTCYFKPAEIGDMWAYCYYYEEHTNV